MKIKCINIQENTKGNHSFKYYVRNSHINDLSFPCKKSKFKPNESLEKEKTWTGEIGVIESKGGQAKIKKAKALLLTGSTKLLYLYSPSDWLNGVQPLGQPSFPIVGLFPAGQ